jgi:hypothetical protein
LKTRLGYALVAGKGKRTFVAADDPRHPRYRKPRTDRPRPTGRPPGTQRAPDRLQSRPPDRPPEGTERAPAKDASTSGRRPRGRPRAPTAGQQAGLFAEPQPP